MMSEVINKVALRMPSNNWSYVNELIDAVLLKDPINCEYLIRFYEDEKEGKYQRECKPNVAVEMVEYMRDNMPKENLYHYLKLYGKYNGEKDPVWLYYWDKDYYINWLCKCEPVMKDKKLLILLKSLANTLDN